MVFRQKTFLTLMCLLMLMIAACATQEQATQDDAMMEDHEAIAEDEPVEDDSMMDEPMEDDAMMDEVPVTGTGEIKTFVLTGENFKFTMDGEDDPVLRVNKGDTVRIEFTSKSGMHDWVVDEFDARTKQVKTGESTTVEFVADEAGTFEYYCSVGSHRANGMLGQLIVE